MDARQLVTHLFKTWEAGDSATIDQSGGSRGLQAPEMQAVINRGFSPGNQVARRSNPISATLSFQSDNSYRLFADNERFQSYGAAIISSQ